MILTLLLVAAVAASPGARKAKPDARTAPTTGPAAAMKALAAAYELRDPETLGALYTADYEYLVVRQAWDGPTLPKTFGRDDELLGARNLFRGVSPDGKTAMPAAQSIDVRMEGLTESADPQHPDSLDCYRLIVCQQFALNMKLANGQEVKTTPTLHVFHLVRGDAAVLTAGQTIDPKQWYIRRWVDDVKGVANSLALRKGDCEPPPVPIEALVPGLQLSIQPLGNPACPTIDVMCVIPRAGSVTIEVFDVAGRRVSRRAIEVKEAGPQRMQAGSGSTIPPGAYFVRVSQGTTSATQKVLVAGPN